MATKPTYGYDNAYQSYTNSLNAYKQLGSDRIGTEGIAALESSKKNLDIFDAATAAGLAVDSNTDIEVARQYLSNKGTLADIEANSGYLAGAKAKGYTGADNFDDAYHYLDSYSAITKQAEQANIDTTGKSIQEISDMITGSTSKSTAFNEVATSTERTAETVKAAEDAQQAAYAEQAQAPEQPTASRRKGDYLSPAESFAQRNPDRAGGTEGSGSMTPAESYQMRQQQREREAVSNLDIITDPVTGNSYARDLSIPGSTYKPYTPKPVSSSTSIAPRTQVTSDKKPEAPATVEDILSTYGFGLSGNASQQFKLAPAKSFKDVYEGLYESLGLGDVKKNISDTLDKVNDLDQELADKVADVNENPWLSEGVRVKQIQQLEDRYALKKAPFASNLTLYENLYNDGREEARYVATQALQQYNTEREFQLDQVEFLIDQAEKAQEAKAKLAEKSKPIEISPGATLFDPDTGKAIYTAPVSKSTSSSSSSSSGDSSGGTQEERYQGTLDKARTLFTDRTYRIPNTQGIPYTDSDGFATKEGWLTIIASAGIPREKFISEFGYLLRSSTDKDGNVVINPVYGLSAAEKKLVGGI